MLLSLPVKPYSDVLILLILFFTICILMIVLECHLSFCNKGLKFIPSWVRHFHFKAYKPHLINSHNRRYKFRVPGRVDERREKRNRKYAYLSGSRSCGLTMLYHILLPISVEAHLIVPWLFALFNYVITVVVRPKQTLWHFILKSLYFFKYLNLTAI